jgi:hypothetical protein
MIDGADALRFVTAIVSRANFIAGPILVPGMPVVS